MRVFTSLVVVAALLAPSVASTSSLKSETSDLTTEETRSSVPSSALSKETSSDSSLQDLEGIKKYRTKSTTKSSSPSFDDLTESTDLSESTGSAMDLVEDKEDTSDSTTDLLEGNATESSGETDTMDVPSSKHESTKQSTSDVNFSEELKAIWIERHSFFRVAALPWAAGNMRRMCWDNDLAEKAASAISSCTANTSTGINVYESSSTDPSTVLEEAINEWVIKPVMSEIGRVVPPAAEGDTVGAGMYNSYSQVVWASTTSVGCAMSKCSEGLMVACEYSPAGNDGKSEWYIHAAQATQCPEKTTASAGLCVVEGDPSNDPIAPVPDDKTSLKVYPTFIVDLMSTILKGAKDRDAPGAKPSRIDSSKKSSHSELFPGEETDEASSPESEEELETEESPTSTLTDDSSLSDESIESMKESDDLKSSGITKSKSSSDYFGTEDEASSPTTDKNDETMPDSSKVSEDEVTELAEPSTTGQGKKMPGSSLSSAEDLDEMESSLSSQKKSSDKKKSPSFGGGLDDSSSLDSPDGGATLETDSPSATSGTPKSAPTKGVSKKSLNRSGASGSTTASVADEELSQDQKPSLASGSDLEEPNQSPPAESKVDSPTQDESTKQETKSPDSSATSAVAVKNLSSSSTAPRALLSPAAIAGIVVLGVVALAAAFVFISYRKNQQRQEDILRNGGIQCN
ncbi:hypothetical protein PsorP6_011140 [Peronosclerospora sorghi]|uniref:Uncharacterized protein n=1 Tax=Peronosclerospora sorghi TaxID=230839 RepID=A0ACC0VXM0_9STRA|nr:hypothetical protein PsorP6_011140 [Peronosclerospora sorghi]